MVQTKGPSTIGEWRVRTISNKQNIYNNSLTIVTKQPSKRRKMSSWNPCAKNSKQADQCVNTDLRWDDPMRYGTPNYQNGGLPQLCAAAMSLKLVDCHCSWVTVLVSSRKSSTRSIQEHVGVSHAPPLHKDNGGERTSKDQSWCEYIPLYPHFLLWVFSVCSCLSPQNPERSLVGPTNSWNMLNGKQLQVLSKKQKFVIVWWRLHFQLVSYYPETNHSVYLRVQSRHQIPQTKNNLYLRVQSRNQMPKKKVYTMP